MSERRAKYEQEEIDALGKKGRAFKDAVGAYSYPIADTADLKDAIRAVGRGGAAHDVIRKYVIKRAKALKQSDLIPDNWSADGSLKESSGVWSTLEERETYMDLSAALTSVISETLPTDDDGYCYCWVQDFTDAWVVYQSREGLFQASYVQDAEGNITLGQSTKVRPVTTYVETNNASPLLEWRKKKVALIRGLERREFSTSDLEIREADDGETWKLTGYASVTDTPYDVGFYTETIRRGAFKRTLKESPDVQLLINHEGLPLARTRSNTLRLEERDAGLWVDADLDKQDPDAQRLYRKMQRGDIDQMSFAFQVTDQDWDEDYSSRTIKSVSIHRGDVSVVNQGANAASTASIRSTEALSALRRVGVEGVFGALKEFRAGMTLSAATSEVLTRVLELVANADEAVDEAQPLLADLMGVPNPDADDASEADEPEENMPERSAIVPQPGPIPDHTTRARERLAALRRA